MGKISSRAMAWSSENGRRGGRGERGGEREEGERGEREKGVSITLIIYKSHLRQRVGKT